MCTKIIAKIAGLGLLGLAACSAPEQTDSSADKQTFADVDTQRILENSPSTEWLSYGGGYDEQRHSRLAKITVIMSLTLALPGHMTSPQTGGWKRRQLSSIAPCMSHLHGPMFMRWTPPQARNCGPMTLLSTKVLASTPAVMWLTAV